MISRSRLKCKIFRSNAQKRADTLEALADPSLKNLSSREVAKHAGVSFQTILRYRRAQAEQDGES